MKIAAFNVENMFDRPKAFNLDDNTQSSKIIKKAAQLNALFEKKTYSAANKASMIALMMDLDLGKSDRGDFVLLRKIRGKIVKRANTGLQIVANGRDDWIGWVELKTAPVNETAVLNTARVIHEADADVLAVIEAENRVSLNLFSEKLLQQVGGTPYPHVMVIDGNDTRGIDVGIMTKADYKIGTMRSHIHDLKADGHPVFSRDCPEYAVTASNGECVWVLPNHFKSKFGGDNSSSRAKREAQAARVAEIYQSLRAAGENNVVVLGDFNDTPNSAPLQPLLANTDLRDVGEHPSFDTGQFPGHGTYALGNDNQKIDYLLLSPALFNRVTASGLMRKGAWPGSRPKRWDVFPTLTHKVHAASDHHLIWAEINGL